MNVTANVASKDESTNGWRYSLGMFALFIAHVISQHRLVFLGVASVRTDPCDGVNAFAFYAMALIALGSIARLFSPRHSTSLRYYLYTIRSQQAVLFALFITFMAEIITLTRNLSTWTKIVPPSRLFTVLGGLTAVTVATQLRIILRQRNKRWLSSIRWTRTILPIAFAIGALIICPEWPTDSPSSTAHMLTVALGALVVLIPMRMLVSEVVLNASDVHKKTTFGTPREWTFLIAGIAVELIGFFRHIPLVILDVATLSIAYALLGIPLGFIGGTQKSMQNAQFD